MSVVEVKNLKKYYKVHKKEEGVAGSLKALFRRKYLDVKAVDDISFSLNEGELVGFIGPNGAGKTTTLKCLSGLLYPSAGEVSVLGYKPFDRKTAFLKQISIIMGQKNQLWWDLPAIETFNLNKEIYEVPKKQFENTLGQLTEMLEVKELLKVQVRKLSLGERMKMEIIAGVIHSPKVLFLDEPTIGLDVIMQKKLRQFIKEYNQKYKATIILTSHYMDDVKELCKRVILIDKGKLVFDNGLDELIHNVANHKLLTVVLDKPVSKEQLEEIGEVVEYAYPKVVLKVKREDIVEKSAEVIQKLQVTDITVEEPKIEDVIREVFSGKDVA
jgi:ABC-2 type transport system ATP-binding protein